MSETEKNVKVNIFRFINYFQQNDEKSKLKAYNF